MSRISPYRLCNHPEKTLLTGPWTDIGHGHCERCHTYRRLYQPAVRPELTVCAPCSQIYAVTAFAVVEREVSEPEIDDGEDGADEGAMVLH